jgi:hypothetical protein
MRPCSLQAGVSGVRDGVRVWSAVAHYILGKHDLNHRIENERLQMVGPFGPERAWIHLLNV